MPKTKTLLVTDGMNYLHRGYWAINYNMTNKDGNPTAAIRGFISILLADLVFVKATHCAVVFDRPGKNFRHRLYPEYKANRETDDDEDSIDLHSQIRPLRMLLKAMGIPVFGRKGEEGDDLIGSLAVTASELDPKLQVYIGSNDKDFASLVNKDIHLLQPQKEILDIQGVKDKWGVKPSQMIEYLMLLGDKVDNIPGVFRVGPKTAAGILTEHKRIKNWIPTKKTPALQKNLDAVVDFFPTSRKLITIKTDCFPDLDVRKLRIKDYDEDEIERICDDLDFSTTKKQILKSLNSL